MTHRATVGASKALSNAVRACVRACVHACMHAGNERLMRLAHVRRPKIEWPPSAEEGKDRIERPGSRFPQPARFEISRG